jgi:hypothetical protein
MNKTLFGALLLLPLLGGCWVPVQATSPSDNVVYVVVRKFGFVPAGMVVRCDGPQSCVEVYRP